MKTLIFGFIAMRNGYTHQQETFVREPDKFQPFDVQALAHLYHKKTMSAQKECNLPITHHGGIVAVRPTVEIMTQQQLPSFVGISEATAGAKGISMNLVIIPPGGAAIPHLHRGFETAIYIINGQVETRYGPG